LKIANSFISSFKGMRKFFLKVLLIAPLIILLAFIAIILPPNNRIRNTSIFAIPSKNLLLQNTPQPRIIFIGGSNLSFGLNSRMIKDSLGINPINTGIDAGLGLKFMLSNNLKYIQKGDIVVISPEYQQFYGDLADGNIELLSTIIDVLHSINKTNLNQLLRLLPYVPRYASSKLKLWDYFKKADTLKVGIVDKHSYNCYGDAFIHWDLPKPKICEAFKIAGKLNSDSYIALKKFGADLKKRGAVLFVTFPCYQAKSFEESRSQIKDIEKRLEENGFELLGNPERYKMNDSLIFNTPYHLTKKGADFRTLLLIEDLKKQRSSSSEVLSAF
jgi:hypothetical protein